MKEPLLSRQTMESSPSSSTPPPPPPMASPPSSSTPPPPMALPPSSSTTLPSPTPSRNRTESTPLPQTSPSPTPSGQANSTEDSLNINSQTHDTRDNTPDAIGNGKNTGQSTTSKKRILLIAFCGIYFIIIVANFCGTFGVVDGLYLTVATTTTVGYGDVGPKSAVTKLLTAIFALIVLPLMGALPTCLVDWPRAGNLRCLTLFQTYMHSMRNYTRSSKGKKVLLAVVIVCVLLGAVLAYYKENLNCVDSFYLSVISATTIGYGDYSFSSKEGKKFAIFWLFITRLAFSLLDLTNEFNSWLNSPEWSG